jgi:hypothetical protein
MFTDSALGKKMTITSTLAATDLRTRFETMTQEVTERTKRLYLTVFNFVPISKTPKAFDVLLTISPKMAQV